MAGTHTEPSRMIVHEATYRVVVLKNPEPAHEHDAVHAECLEQNLGGRGADVAAALHDLATNVSELLATEYSESQAETEPNIDPVLEGAFNRKTNEVDGCPVIRRGMLRIRLEHVTDGEPSIRAAEMTFQPVAA